MTRWLFLFLLASIVGVGGSYWVNGCQASLPLVPALCFAGIFFFAVLFLRKRLARNWNALPPLLKTAVLVFVFAACLLIPAAQMTSRVNDRFFVDVTITGEKNPASGGQEVWLNAVLVDDMPIDLHTLALSEDWHRHEDSGSVWGSAQEGAASSTLRIGPYTDVERIELHLGSHPWSGCVRLVTESQEISQDLYSAQMTVISRCFEAPEASVQWDRMTLWDTLLFALSYLAAAVLLFVLLLLGAGQRWLFVVLYAAFSAILWLYSPYIAPSRSALLVIGALSVSGVYGLYRNRKNTLMNAYQKKGYAALILCVSLYASFASFGYRLFLAGDYMTLSSDRVLYLLLGAVWFVPIIMLILSALERWGNALQLRDNPSGTLPRWAVCGVVSLVALACLTISFIGFYPGGFPGDVADQIAQAQSNTYNNWHPAVHTWIIKLILSLCNNPACITYVQLILFALLIGRVALIPYDCGVKLTHLCLGAAVFALLPNQAVANISPIKDFLFTYSLIWGMVLLFEIGRDVSVLRKPGMLVQIVLSMYFIKELRHNGMIPLVFMAIVLLIVTFRHWNAIKLRAVACLVAAVVLICGTDGPLFRALHVQPNPVKPYVTMFCGVGSCLNKGKTFSEETNARLEDVMSTEAWAEYYGRFVGHDNYLWGDGENSAGMDLSSFGLTESFRIYFEALFRYPDIVIKDRLDGMNIMWDVTQPDDADSFNVRVFDAVFIHSEAGLVKEGYEDGAYYYPDNPIANFYRSLVHFAVEGEDERDQVTDMLLWRSGAYLIFLLVLIIYWLKNRLGRMWWPAMPLLGNIGAMVLVLYHQSFRYIYFIQLGVLALAFMTFSMQRTLCRNKPAVPPAEDSTESE